MKLTKLISSITAVVAIVASIATMSVGAEYDYSASDSYSNFYCSRTTNVGFVEIQNITSTTRWGSVSMTAYSSTGGIIGTDGYSNSLSRNAVCNKRTMFSSNFHHLSCSGYLYYGNNPNGSTISSYSKTLNP